MKPEIIGENCGYCQGGELHAKYGIKICDMDVSQLILFKEQSNCDLFTDRFSVPPLTGMLVEA